MTKYIDNALIKLVRTYKQSEVIQLLNNKVIELSNQNAIKEIYIKELEKGNKTLNENNKKLKVINDSLITKINNKL
tara:strand:- start:420 stop:647 length:228 start_codon:yes stop_codon:yes gene_type:complete